MEDEYELKPKDAKNPEKVSDIFNLEKVEKRWSYALESSGVGVWDWDIGTGEVYFSKIWKSMLGYDEDEIKDNLNEWKSRVHPEDLSRVNLTVQRYLSGRSDEYYCEHRMKCKNGSYLWILDQGKIIERYPDGSPKRMTGTHTDISKAKQTEQNILNSEAVFRSLFEQASIGLARISPSFHFEKVNRRFVEIMKYRSSELTGINIHSIFGDAINPLIDSFTNRAGTVQGGALTAEFICKTKETSNIWLNITMNPVMKTSSEPDYYILIIDDISHKKRVEAVLQKSREELEYANRILEEASRMKDNFLAGMSHELRTPLTSILGITEALQQGIYGDIQDEQNEALKLVTQSGEHLLSLINDILDVSKAAAGQMEIKKEVIDLMKVCNSALRMITPLAQNKNITINFSMIPTELMIEADPKRLKQIILNVLSNSIKFTPNDGNIGFLVTADINNNKILISIEDTGIGMSREHLIRAFEPFVQIDSTLSRQIAGTGLGLSIVKSFTELHGGSVRIDSEPGRGTVVEIELPWQYGQTSGSESASDEPIEKPNILVVEDSPEDRHTMSYLLKKLGYNAWFSNFLGDTITVADKVEPRVILVDINLPGESGWEIITRLKSMEKFNGIPVIVCSAAEEVADAEVNGANGYLRKPYSFSELSLEIERVLSFKPASRYTGTKRKLILLAEDNLTNAGTFRDFLASKEYEVLMAYNGEEAVSLASEYHPDLILMDVQMPMMDGLEATRKIRGTGDGYLQSVPVIALTAMVMPGDQEKCFASGANDYLAKPVSLLKLESKIKKFLD